MRVSDVFQSNDWEIKKFLGFVLAIQLAMLATIGLDAIGLRIPFLRQAIGFINLTFIPGLIILRILKLHQLNVTKSILFSVGLSLTFIMIVGWLVNSLYPLVGTSRPLSSLPLIATIEGVLFILCLICYKRDRGFAQPSYINAGELLSAPTLFLVLLPLLSMLGTYMMNSVQDNRLLLLLITLIAITPLIVVFSRFIPGRLYPLAVVSIAIALLYHQSLITPYLVGYDIHHEYWLQELVGTNGRWDLSSPVVGGNAMLSVTILPAIYRCLLNIDGIWLFKAIYPLISSMIILTLSHLADGVSESAG